MLDKLKEWAGVLKAVAWVVSTVVVGIGMGFTYGQTIAQEAGREAAQEEVGALVYQVELMNERDQREEDRQLWERCYLYEHPDLDDEAKRMRCDDESDWRWDQYYPWEDCRSDAHNYAQGDTAVLAEFLERCQDEPEYNPESP